MKKILLLWYLFTIVSMNSYAQNAFEVSIGSYFGNVNATNCDEGDCWIYTDEVDFSGSRGLRFATQLSFPINKMLSIHPGIAIVKKGFQVEDNEDQLTFNMNYLDFPVLVRVQYPIQEKITVYASTGLNFGITLGGSIKYTDEDDHRYYYPLISANSFSDLPNNSIDGFPVKNTNLSFLLNIGVSASLNKSSYIFANLGYEIGNTDFVLLTGSDNQANLRGTMISIGYGFNLVTNSL